MTGHAVEAGGGDVLRRGGGHRAAPDGGQAAIASVRLVNFKNFADETLRLGPFTVIVGTNASGKSNIRDAFRFLHGIGRGYTLADIVGGIHGAGGQTAWEPIRGAANEIARFGQPEFTLEVGIDLSAREADVKGLRPFFKDLTSSAPAGTSYVIRVGRDATPERGFSVLDASLRANTGHSWKISKNWRRHDGSIDFFLPSALFDEEDRESVFLGLLIRRTFDDIRFLDPVPRLMRQPSFPGQTVLGDSGENLPTVLQGICADKKRKGVLTSWIRELTPMDVADFRFPTDPSGRVHLMMREESGREVSAHSASDGTLRFLAMLAALLGPNPAGLYFIEEMENGIHPSRLHLLLDLIERQTAKGKIQVVATTHSPALLSAMGDRAFENTSVVCRLEDTDDAIVRPLSEIPNARELRRTQGLGRLLEGGWMEDALAFTEGDDAESSG